MQCEKTSKTFLISIHFEFIVCLSYRSETGRHGNKSLLVEYFSVMCMFVCVYCSSMHSQDKTLLDVAIHQEGSCITQTPESAAVTDFTESWSTYHLSALFVSVLYINLISVLSNVTQARVLLFWLSADIHTNSTACVILIAYRCIIQTHKQCRQICWSGFYKKCAVQR